MDNMIMTRVEYFYQRDKDKVEFYRAARKDLRQAQKRAGVARLPAKMVARQAHYAQKNAASEAHRLEKCRELEAHYAQKNAAINQRHYSRQYFDIITMWEWNRLHLWIPKEVQ